MFKQTAEWELQVYNLTNVDEHADCGETNTQKMQNNVWALAQALTIYTF